MNSFQTSTLIKVRGPLTKIVFVTYKSWGEMAKHPVPTESKPLPRGFDGTTAFRRASTCPPPRRMPVLGRDR